MPPSSSPLRISVADLLRRPGASRDVHVESQLGDLRTTGAEISSARPVEVDATLERISEGVVVRGIVHAHWDAVCSRCLIPVEGEVTVHVDELFEPQPLEGETYRLDDDSVDLEPMVRDALVFELPAAPLCDPDCAGLCPTCGADRNTTACECRTEDLDPRWAALRSLDF